MTPDPEMANPSSLPDSSSETPSQAGEPVWSLGSALLFLLLAIALLFTIQIASLFIAAALSKPDLLGSEEFGLYLEEFLHHIQANPYAAFADVLTVLLTWLVTFKLVEIFFRGAPRPAVGKALGLGAPAPRWAMLAAVPAGALFGLIGLVISDALQTDPTTTSFDSVVQTVPGFVAVSISALLIAPIAEEAFFRGFLFPPLRRYLSPATAILVNGALFALMHLSESADISILLPILLLGSLAAALRNWSGSIWPGAMAHLFFNGMSLFIFLLNKGPTQA